MSSILKVALLCIAIAAAPLRAAPSDAQPWPVRPIKLVVTFAPGGSADVTARIVSDGLATELKQPVVIENKSGASGNIGADAVAKAVPDGYTFLLATNSVHAINPSLFKTMPFKAVDDFDPVGNLTRILHVLVVRPTLPVRNVEELVALARSEKNGLTYGSAGPGSIPHLAAELFQKMTGTQILHVPYRGGSPANVALLGGSIDMMFTAYANVREYIAAGKLRLLGTLEPQRIATLPDIPSVSEVVPGYSATGYYGILAPKGTPAAIRNRLFEDSQRVLQSQAVKSRLEGLGLIPDPIGPEAFEKRLKADLVEWAGHIKQIGIEPN